mmetsp:Transcript_21090/g.32681  ORF Transcript_21090/g.32681 Transcript_21090/m.32681 type:complete len:87 (-) Transcript_21090:245-505(-)
MKDPLEAKLGAIPELQVLSEAPIPLAKINLTPSSYNGLVNIYHLLFPHANLETAQRYFGEKESIVNSSVFKAGLHCFGVRSTTEGT